MTTPNRPRTKNFERLLEIARRSGVQVHFISAEPFGDLGWYGLYLASPQLGAGIALRDDLSSEDRDWILAHELGHHFSRLNLRLFSPFCAHMVDAATRQRWGELRSLHPDEERANNWAIKTLVDSQEWEDAERESPCDLPTVVKKLGLPVAAGVACGRRLRSLIKSEQTIAVKFTTEEWRRLHHHGFLDGWHPRRARCDRLRHRQGRHTPVHAQSGPGPGR